MSSACPQIAKNIFSDTKRRLSERVGVNINNSASVAREIIRGSKSNEILMQSAKGLAQQEVQLDNGAKNLKKILLIQEQLRFQREAIKEGAETISNISEQVNSMER